MSHLKAKQEEKILFATLLLPELPWCEIWGGCKGCCRKVEPCESLFFPKQSIAVSPVASFSCISSPKSCFSLLKGFSGLRCALSHVKPDFTRLWSPKLFSGRNGANLSMDTLPTAAAGLWSPPGKGIPNHSCPAAWISRALC